MRITLGTRFYDVSKEGRISPRLVLELPFATHEDSFLDVGEAIKLARERIPDTISQADSISTRKELGQYLESLNADPAAFIQGLKTAMIPFQRRRHGIFDAVDQNDEMVDVMKIPSPSTDYFTPGKTVYGVITPRVGHIMSGGSLPELYFVMKVKVMSVSWITNQRIWHRLNSGYCVNGRGKDLFPNQEAATDRLCDLIMEQVPANPIRSQIKVFTWLDEKKRKEKILDSLVSRKV